MRLLCGYCAVIVRCEQQFCRKRQKKGKGEERKRQKKEKGEERKRRRKKEKEGKKEIRKKRRRKKKRRRPQMQPPSEIMDYSKSKPRI